METREERKEKLIRQRKKQISEAAIRIFSKKGFGETTIPEIALEAGVATGTIYNYYPSKRDLLVNIVKDFIITEPFMELFKNARDSDFPTFINAVINNRMDFLNKYENRPLFFLMGEIQRDQELKRLYVKQVIKPVMDIMERFYGNGVASGSFHTSNPIVVTRAIGGMVIGMILLDELEGENSPIKTMPRQEFVSELTNIILHGIYKN